MEPGTARSARRDRAGGSRGRAGRRRPPRLPRSTCHKSRPGSSRHVTPATGAAAPTRVDRKHVLPGPPQRRADALLSCLACTWLGIVRGLALLTVPVPPIAVLPPTV